MVTVSFYTFSKKQNSTKRPSGTALGSYDCLLKEPSGVITPEIFLGNVGSSIPSAANYAYISDFGRYYYITDWTWNNGGWTASLKVDVLATYKTQIGSSTQYVRRAQSAYNLNVIDDAIPTTPRPYTKRSGFAKLVGANDYYYLGDPFGYKSLDSGWFVVGIINGDVNAVGACSYYAFNSANFKAFKNVFTDIASYTNDTSQQDILRAQFNPINYIASVKWFPCDIPMGSTGVSSLSFGWWTLTGPYTCYRVTGSPTVISARRTSGARMPKNAMTTTDNYSVGIPHNAQSMQYYNTGDLRHSHVDNGKYCKYTLECHPFGIFPLPADIVANTSDLYLSISVDPISGEGSMRLTAQGIKNSGELDSRPVELASATTRIAIDIPLAQIAVDNLGIASSAIDVAGGLTNGALGVASGGLLGDIDGLATAAKAGINMIASSVPQVKSIGSMGSLADYYMSTEPIVVAEFHYLEAEAPASIGYPVAQNKQINTLSGFIMCGNVELDLPATASEQDEVVALMQGGFEYE